MSDLGNQRLERLRCLSDADRMVSDAGIAANCRAVAQTRLLNGRTRLTNSLFFCLRERWSRSSWPLGASAAIPLPPLNPAPGRLCTS